MQHSAIGREICSLNITVIDDNPAMLDLCASVLKGFRVARIRNFRSAHEALPRLKDEAADLVITDWRMKPMNGQAFVKALRHETSTSTCLAPVLVITAYPSREMLIEALRAGAQTVLAKPFSPIGLYRRLEWILKDERDLSLKDERYQFTGIEGIVAALGRKRVIRKSMLKKPEMIDMRNLAARNSIRRVARSGSGNMQETGAVVEL